MRMTIRDSLLARTAHRRQPTRTASQPRNPRDEPYRFGHLDYGVVPYYDQLVFKRHRQTPPADTAHPRDEERSPAPVRLAGIHVGPLAVEELSLRLQAAGNLVLSTSLGRAAAEGEIEVVLSDEQRGEILLALEDCPAGFLRLRDVLSLHSEERGAVVRERGSD
jgi:hypothetical protein